MISTTQPISSVFQQIPLMNDAELNLLIQQASEEKNKRLEKIEFIFGKTFSEILGKETIFNIPEFEEIPWCITERSHWERRIMLDYYINSKVYEKLPKPTMHHVAVRGMISFTRIQSDIKECRPFIAIKIDLLNPTSKKVEDTVIEFLIKCFSSKDGDKIKYENPLFIKDVEDKQNAYSTTLTVISKSGRKYPSMLSDPKILSDIYFNTPMTDNKMIQSVKDLLDGKEFKAPYADYIIRAATS